MAKVKEEIIDMIRRMPDESSIEDIMEELYFREQVDAGLRDLAEGRTISHEEMKERVRKWLE
jgi:predicted transcriptional regulator